jgi:hypothetical protein
MKVPIIVDVPESYDATDWVPYLITFYSHKEADIIYDTDSMRAVLIPTEEEIEKETLNKGFLGSIRQTRAYKRGYKDAIKRLGL